MKPAKGATPLSALEAVAIDTETTGLDVREARIVQFGAVAMPSGRPDPAATFDTLVDPGIPVPAVAEAVHGISDSMVAGKPAFPEAYRGFTDWCGRRPMIGYSIGFDLAVLENECRRHKVAWQKPRTLCVRTLAAIANPDLPDHSLETLAAWLGVAITDRHRAIGDALAAGRIFTALLPHLKRRGIRTLAEAERASLSLSTELEDRVKAGWAEPAIRPGHAAGGMEKVDPYAYRYRVGDVMSSPPVTIAGTVTLRSAIQLMVQRRISSVFVSETGEPGGRINDYRILTERDVMRRIAVLGEAALDARAAECASGPLVSIRRRQFVYRAMGRMNQARIRHLAVVDDHGNLVGAISARDLLKLRADAAIALGDSIAHANSPAAMASAWATLPEVAERLIGEALEARVIAEIVSEELRSMTARASILAERAMYDEGLGAPPCRYAVLVLGSGGRGESLLYPDQDNAIIFEHGEPGGPEDRWFEMLGERFSGILDEAAIPLCKGGVMARNAEWRGNPELWRQRVAEWVRRSSPKDLLNVDIVFDFMPVHGSLELGFAFFDTAFEIGSSHIPFAKQLSAQLENRETPFNFLGRLRSEDGRIDLKKFGLFPIVAGARALAIRHDIRQRSTAGRLNGLIERGIGSERDIRSILEAHEILLGLMLRQQAIDLQSGIPVSNLVEIASLERRQHDDLKHALRLCGLVSEMVRDWMFDRAKAAPG